MELTIVALIIGILALLSIATFGGRGKDARDKACKSNMKAIATAIELYKSDNNTDPADISDLVPDHLKKTPQEPHQGYDPYTIVGGDPHSDADHMPWPL